VIGEPPSSGVVKLTRRPESWDSMEVMVGAEGGGRLSVPKVAVTVFAAVIETVQVLVCIWLQPLQLVNSDPELGVAVRVTLVPSSNAAEHELPQLMPDGELVTDPEPAPALLTVRVAVGPPFVGVKVAVTVFVAVIETVQVLACIWLQPLQLVNSDPSLGVAVRVTLAPSSNSAEHELPQLMPDGELVTDPEPSPALLTVRVG
jgi:hypothetical protein